MIAEGLLDTSGTGGSDPLVDRQGLAQACSTVAGLAIMEVASADTLQGACFFHRRGDVGGDRKGLLVTGAGVGRRSGCQRQLTHVVENLSFPEPVA